MSGLVPSGSFEISCLHLHWSLLIEFSLSFHEIDALNLRVFFKYKYERNKVEFVSAPYNFIDEDIWLLMIQIKRYKFGPNWIPSLPFEYGYSLCCQAHEVAQPCHAYLVARTSLFLFSIEAQRILFEGLRHDSWHERRENSFFYVTNSKLLRSVLTRD
jgi:hypothetical protein